MNAAPEPDELERSVSALLREFAPDVAPPALPAKPIRGLDFFRDRHGYFLTADLVDGSSVYVTLSLGEKVEVFHSAAPKLPPKSRHLFSIRCGSIE